MLTNQESNKPSWARYKATDENGAIHWFEHKPVATNGFWIVARGRYIRVDSTLNKPIDYSTTLTCVYTITH